jgi:hypothetical protein
MTFFYLLMGLPSNQIGLLLELPTFKGRARKWGKRLYTPLFEKLLNSVNWAKELSMWRPAFFIFSDYFY